MAKRIALIVDNGQIARWQLNAIRAAGIERIDVLLDCQNSASGSRRLKHAAYYALNLLAIRNHESQMLPIAESGLVIGQQVAFDAIADGSWQKLPPHIIAIIQETRPEAILKFGMGLLRIPFGEHGAIPILSYHHGDPRAYRGRPAGFWEFLNRAERLGQIVQILSNKLDAGGVVAFAETKIYPHSYRATMIEAYRHSALLLAQAIENAAAGRTLDIEPTGHNYRLPGNFVVVEFVAKMALNWIMRLGRAAFYEHGWQISIGKRPEALANVETYGLDQPSTAVLPIPAGYSFLADPFFDGGGVILAEGLNKRSGKGDLLKLSHDGKLLAALSCGRHLSYPALLPDGRVCPESASWQKPTFYTVTEDSFQPSGGPAIAGDPSLLDPTFWYDGTRYYLFANSKAVGVHALLLYSAPSLEGPFEPHPASPVIISPRGARPGGALFEDDGRLFRWGQDNSIGYGNGLILFEIVRIDPDQYEEIETGPLKLSERQGPHTVNFSESEIVFDHYRMRFNPLAWLTRLKARLR